jgi:hypothetical protein
MEWVISNANVTLVSHAGELGTFSRDGFCDAPCSAREEFVGPGDEFTAADEPGMEEAAVSGEVGAASLVDAGSGEA